MAPSPIKHWLRCAPLGSGSFGRVSLAINLDDGAFFAVKSTPCSSPASEGLRALERELAILQSLQSARIVSCYGSDYSMEGGELSRNLFLEYVDGGSLAELLQKSAGGRLDEARARSITRAVAEGLAYLHKQGIVHCDIKGQNVLVGSNGIKIADFGAATRMGFSDVEDDEEEAPWKLKGTPLWMAPEVVQGLEQGCASDIWSLGCTVVEMLQGTPPWAAPSSHPSSACSRGASITALLYRIACSTDGPPLPKGLSAHCQDFLSKALSRNPKSRWTADQLLDHPWLKAAPELMPYSEQRSPRSTLNFPADSDEEDEVFSALLSCMSCTARGNGPNAAMISPPEDCEWVTVRCADEWQESRYKPFMEQPWKLQPWTKGCEVNFESLAFLLQKRRNTV